MSTRRAAIYVRISDDREGAGLGVERQEKDCRTLANTLGWDVVRVHVDNDISASTMGGRKKKTRPGYQQLLDDLTTGRVDALIVWHNDRLHRSTRELEDFIDVVEAAGAAVQTVKAGKYDLTTPTGRLTARLVGAVAQYESEHKSDRIRAKYVQIAEAGQVGNGGCRPYGYDRSRMVIVEDEAEQLRWAYRQVLAGRSLRSLAHDLTDRGFLTTQGNPWSVQALRLNLLSPRNIALREHRRVVVGPAAWPAIIDVDTWEQVRALLQAPGRSGRRDGGVPTNARRHLLTGFLWCGLCGGKLVPRTSGTTRQRYGCLPGREGGCGGSTVHVDTVDDLITTLAFARLERDADLQPEDTDPTEVLRAAVAADEARLSALAEAFADDADSNPLELRVAGARIRKRIAHTRNAIARAAVQVRISDPLVVREAWAGYDLHQRRAVLSVLIERIEVGRGVPGRFDPSRVSVTWR